MAAAAGVAAVSTTSVALSSKRSEILGGSSGLSRPAASLPSLAPRSRVLKVENSGKKVNTPQPFGPSGGVKFKGGVDASGRKATGKGVYQFSKKYGANVDGYSPIYSRNEWAASGDQYQPGPTGLALWAVTLAGLLVVGAFLVYSTSSLA